jgi:hypothetical protein
VLLGIGGLALELGFVRIELGRWRRGIGRPGCCGRPGAAGSGGRSSNLRKSLPPGAKISPVVVLKL